MIIESIKCDACNKELIVDTQYPAVYALELRSIDVNRNSSNMQFASFVHKPVDAVKHFCNKKCAITFLEETK